jgi:pimeloyl-ACP methyl ester carboxylesterase
MIAAELAAVQPDRFTKLVLISPLGLWNQDRPSIDFFAASPHELATAVYSNSDLRESFDVEPGEPEAKIEYTLDKAKARAAAARFLWPIPNKGLHKRIHRISAPTLLVWGESDGIVPTHYGHDFKERIANASIEVIEDAAHLVHLEQHARVVELVAGFIR